jgi:ABC-type transporter Mla subunit MlaD
VSPAAKKDYDERVYHRPPAGLNATTIGVIAVVVIAIIVYLAFAKSLPFTGGAYQLNAVFENATTLRSSAPVRIAGVNVGEVTGVERDGTAARVTFTVDSEGRPVHEDATVRIRPRLFLEGNFFLDLETGSPSAPELQDDGTIPVTRTSTAVQFDEVLTALQRDDRRSLQLFLDGFGTGLTYQPTAEDDVGVDADIQGLSAAEAINLSFDYGETAGKGTAQVNEALLGTEPHDLSRLLAGQRRIFRALASRQTQLSDLITNFNVTAGAFAAESNDLSRTIAELAPTLEEAEPSLVRLNETLPPLRVFARESEPSIAELGSTIDVGLPWLRQAKPLLADGELGGITTLLHAATPPLARATSDTSGLFEQLGLTARCGSDVFVPTGDIVFDRADDPFKTGLQNYKEFLFTLAQQSGESQTFDGNGQILGVQVGGGSTRVSTPKPGGSDNPINPDNVIYAQTIEPPIGTQPPKADSEPPIREDVACHENDVPDLNGAQAAVGPPNPAAVAP